MENIRVSLRVRPLLPTEILKNDKNCWNLESNNSISLESKFKKEIT